MAVAMPDAKDVAAKDLKVEVELSRSFSWKQ